MSLSHRFYGQIIQLRLLQVVDEACEIVAVFVDEIFE